MCITLVLSHLTSDPFELHLMLDQNQQSCRDLQSFKPVESDDVQQNFWSSGFFGTWSSESSSLECWRRSSELLSSESSSTCSEARSSEAGTVHQNFLSQSFEKLLGKSSEFA